MYQPNENCQKINKLRLITKSLACLILALFVSACSYPTATHADPTIEQLLQQNQQYKQQLNTLYQQQDTLQNQIEIANVQAAAIQSQINTTTAQLNEVNKQIEQTGKEIDDAQTNLDKQKELLGEYLKTMYMNGQTSQVELILTSNSFSDFVDQSQYMDTMTQKIQDTTNQIVALKSELEAKKKDLSIKQDQIKSLLVSQSDQKAALDVQNAQTNALLAESKNSSSNISREVAKNNSQLNILRAIASGNTGGVINGDLVVVNQSFYVNGTEHSYQSQTWFGITHGNPWPENNFTINGTTYSQDYNYIDMYNSGCLVTSLAMAYGETPVQEAGKHYFEDSWMLDSGGAPISSSAADTYLASGTPIVFGIDWNGDGNVEHFVLAISKSNGKYYIDDPYFGAGKQYSSSQVIKYLKP